MSQLKRMKLDVYFLPCKMFSLGWTRNFTVRLETLKLPEENTGTYFRTYTKARIFCKALHCRGYDPKDGKFELHTMQNFLYKQGKHQSEETVCILEKKDMYLM